MRRFLPLLALLAAACQPLPHPFTADMPERGATPIAPPDSVDIVVAPVAGAPKTVAEALAAALRDADIPASTHGTGNRGSDHLLSRAVSQPRSGSDAAVFLAWELRAANGRMLGQGSIVAEEPAAGWRQGNTAVAQDLALKAAPSIAKLVLAPPPPAVAVTEPLLAMGPVTGAPGDGGSTLSRAMSYALGRAHVALAETATAKESFVLTGKVELSPPQAGQQQVKVSWILRRPDGGEIGHIEQQNQVPAGSLDGPWGDVAFAVANAAAPGVAALIEKAKAAGTGAS